MTFINHGVIEGQKDTDYIAGANSPLPYEIRNESGDWRPYLPTREKQRSSKADSMSCVTFSALSSIEAQEKFLTGKENNYSDRFIAKMSGTTSDGNYLYKVGDTIRNLGLVPEEDYLAPPDYTFAQYHAEIPEPLLSQLKAKGKAWLEKWDVKTEWVVASKAEMMKHIKHAPLQIVIPGHAVLNFLCEADIVNYFDTYDPYEKKTPYSNINSCYKYILTPKNMQNDHVKIINYKGTIFIGVGAEDIPQAVALGKAFGREVQVNEKGEITNADIIV